MLSTWGIKLAKFLIRRNLTIEQRITLTNIILDKVAAIPLHGIITTNEEGILLVDGKTLEYEQALNLRDSARSALHNQALSLIMMHAKFQAISTGIHQASNSSELFFGKAAIWWGEQVESKLKLLAQEDSRETTP